MSDYTKTTDFAAKDALTSGNANKVIKGTEIDTEFNNLATAIATKYDAASDLPTATTSAVGVFELATTAEATALSANDKYITPSLLNSVLAANGGMAGDIQALADPNADTLLTWDDSAGAVVAMALASDGGLAISATPDLAIDISSISASFSSGSDIAGADLFLVDNGAGGTNTKISYQNFGLPISEGGDFDGTTPMASADLTYANRFYKLNNASAITFTIPANASVAYPIGTTFILFQEGAGQVTVGVTSDTLRSPNGAKTAQQYSVIQVVKVASTEWVVFGDTSS